jgi:hypothetical protein
MHIAMQTNVSVCKSVFILQTQNLTVYNQNLLTLNNIDQD